MYIHVYVNRRGHVHCTSGPILGGTYTHAYDQAIYIAILAIYIYIYQLVSTKLFATGIALLVALH